MKMKLHILLWLGVAIIGTVLADEVITTPTKAATTDTPTTARNCQSVSCPVNCPDGHSYEEVKGNDGCIQKCRCRKHTKEEACQIVNCQKGFRCSLVVVNCIPGRFCPGPTGTCVKDPTCPELDCGDCPNGSIYEEERDESGCVTNCRCGPHEACRLANCSANQVCKVTLPSCVRPAQCPEPVAHCESCPQKQCTCSEFEQLSEHTDDNGCVQCQCSLRQNAEPICNRNCPLGSKCIFRNVQCVTTPCEPTQECEECDPVSCSKNCEHGWMQDDQGCDICKCKSAPSTESTTTTTAMTTTNSSTTSPTATEDPCRLVDCKSNKPVCVVREWDCDPEWGNCPKPKAVCIASLESDNCPPKDCPMDCGVEYIIVDACPVCRCTSVPYDPCKYIGPCQDGSVCEVMPPPCEGVGCVNFARCTRVAGNCSRDSLPCLASMTCDGGFVIDQDGCETCRCRPCDAICPRGKTCGFEEGNCEQQSCLSKQICIDIACPPLGCPPCPEDMIRDPKPDENGCQTSCACKEKYPTCKTHVCGPQQICKMVDQRCSQFAPECPKVPICKDVCTGNNEVFSQCMGHCDRNCGDPENKRCSKQCQSGCICQEGYARNGSRECIRENYCPDVCTGNNEVFSQCMGHCDRNCGDPENKRCTKQCQSGCICQEGYARNESRECIREKYCPEDTKTCPPNEIRSCTDGPCYIEPTCATGSSRWNTELPCSSPCYVQCLCKKRYIRSQPNEQCILKSWCPKIKK